MEGTTSQRFANDELSVDDLATMAEQTPIIKFVNLIIGESDPRQGE